MGLFTNKCRNPECRQRVRKGSQYCPKCGESAPKGLSACGACGTEVGTSSKFCWKCGADLSQVAKPILRDQRWARRDEDFAVRVDDQDVRGWLTKPLEIEHGTKAMLFQAGEYKGELAPGRYDMGGFLKRLNHFMIDHNASVVLMDAGDVAIDLENAGLWTADNFEVGAVARVVLRVNDPDAMFVNLFKGRNHVGVDALECQLADEVQMLLAGIVAKYPVERLYSDAGIRTEIENQLRDALTTTLNRLGLELVQVRFISFVGEAFEKLRAERGELAVEEGQVALTEQRNRLNQRLRETLTQEKMDEFSTEKEFEEFVRQTEHELGLKDVVRADEMDRLKERFRYERDRDALLRRIELAGIENDERREQAWKSLLAEERERDERHRRELDRRLAATKSEADARNIRREMERLDHAEQMRQAEAEHLQDFREGQDGIKLLKELKDVEQGEKDRAQQREARTLEARSKAGVEALLSIVDGPAGDRIAELEKYRLQQSMSPEQLLAMTAAASPAVAETLARKYESEGAVSDDIVHRLEAQLADQRQTAEGHADRMERLMRVAMTEMGAVAGTRARAADPKQTIVTGGGQTRPVVINPQQSESPASCKHCGAALDGDGAFCPQCGKKQ